jgi:hypothetical protein
MRTVNKHRRSESQRTTNRTTHQHRFAVNTFETKNKKHDTHTHTISTTPMIVRCWSPSAMIVRCWSPCQTQKNKTNIAPSSPVGPPHPHLALHRQTSVVQTQRATQDPRRRRNQMPQTPSQLAPGCSLEALEKTTLEVPVCGVY